MKIISKPSYYCKDCNKELTLKDKVCPYCGSNKRIINLTISETLTPRGSLISRKYPRGIKKWVLETISGWFLSTDKAKHPNGVKKIRIINRENPKKPNSYKEKIIDSKTGKIIRDIEEPLEKHK